MSDVEYLLACAKQCHEAKDTADIWDIAQDIGQLDNIYQQGNPNAVIHFIQNVIAKHQTEADEHDKGRTPAQDIHQLYYSCRNFLVGLGRDKVEKKVRGKIAEEALKHLGGN